MMEIILYLKSSISYKSPLMKYLFTLSFILLSLSDVFCQTNKAEPPYEPQFKSELPILATVGAGIGVSWYLRTQIEPLTSVQIDALDRRNVPSFDRRATRKWSTAAATWSEVTTYTNMALPLVLLADETIRKDFKPVLLMGFETFLVSDMLSRVAQVAARRTRPYAFNDFSGIGNELKTDRNARFSFYSTHTSHAAALSFFSATVYNDYHPNSKFKPYIWTGAAVLPLVTGVLRYHSGQEFPSDIIAGYIVGASIGWFVPWLHKKLKRGRKN